jgi:hypothetical protein
VIRVYTAPALLVQRGQEIRRELSFPVVAIGQCDALDRRADSRHRFQQSHSECGVKPRLWLEGFNHIDQDVEGRSSRFYDTVVKNLTEKRYNRHDDWIVGSSMVVSNARQQCVHRRRALCVCGRSGYTSKRVRNRVGPVFGRLRQRYPVDIVYAFEHGASPGRSVHFHA